MKVVMLRIAVPDQNADFLAEELYRNVSDICNSAVRKDPLVPLFSRVEEMTQEDKDILAERTAEEG